MEDEPAEVAILNKKAASETDVDSASCLIMSGLIEDGIVGKIREQLDRKFNSQASPDLLNNIAPNLPENGYLAYAYLFRALPFEYPLMRLKEPLPFGSTKVASFGLRDLTWRDSHRAEQVRILDYKDKNDFVIELQPKDKTERIVLAKIAPAETLQQTIEAVRSRIAAPSINEWQQHLQSRELLTIPILNFELWKQV